MKKSNLRNFQAYRMYQAPEGGAEKPVRTSYLKDLSEGSTGRGGGGSPAHPQRQGQNMSGHYLSGQKLSGQNVSPLLCQVVASGVTVSQGAGSCPVMDALHSTRQEPSDGRRIAKPASVTTAGQFKVRRRLGGS